MVILSFSPQVRAHVEYSLFGRHAQLAQSAGNSCHKSLIAMFVAIKPTPHLLRDLCYSRAIQIFVVVILIIVSMSLFWLMGFCCWQRFDGRDFQGNSLEVQQRMLINRPSEAHPCRCLLLNDLTSKQAAVYFHSILITSLTESVYLSLCLRHRLVLRRNTHQQFYCFSATACKSRQRRRHAHSQSLSLFYL